MKTTKRIIALLCLLAMVIGVFAGCGGNADDTPETTPPVVTQPAAQTPTGDAPTEAAPVEDTKLFAEPTKISLYTVSTESWPFQENWYVLDLIKEYTNVELDVQAVPAGTETDKFTLTMAGGDLPDIMITHIARANEYGPQGAYINVLDYIDQMPNFKAWYEEHYADVSNCFDAEGNLYMFPRYGNDKASRMGWIYRADIFEELNLEVPTTDEEFYNCLVAIKQAYPDSYPLTFRNMNWDLSTFAIIAPSWGSSWYWPNTNRYFGYNYDTKEWTFGPTSDAGKEMVEFYAKLYKEGLIMPNYLTVDSAGWEDAITNSQSFITADYLVRVDGFTSAMAATDPDFRMESFAAPACGTYGVAEIPVLHAGSNGLAVSALSKNLDAVLKYVDWMYSDEAYDVLSWGRPGELYTEAADGSRTWNTYTSTAELFADTGLQVEGFYNYVDFETQTCLMTEALKRAHDIAERTEMPAQPALALNAEETRIKDACANAIMTHCNQEISKFLLGQRSMDEWDDFVAEVEALGLAELKAMHESAYARQGS